MQELLGQSHHHSEKVRVKALQGLTELLSEHPKVGHLHASEIISNTSERAVDSDKACREAYCLFLRVALFPILGKAGIQPFIPLLMGHVCSALTHLSHEIRISGIEIMQILLQWRPDIMARQYFVEIGQHFVDSLGRSSRGRSLNAGSLNTLYSLIKGLHVFLSATAPYISSGEEISRFEGCAKSFDSNGLENSLYRKSYLLNWRRCGWQETSKRNQMQDQGSELEETTSVAIKLLTVLLSECWEDCGLCSSSDRLELQRGPQKDKAYATGTLVLKNAAFLLPFLGQSISGHPCKGSSVADILLTRVFPHYPDMDGDSHEIQEIDTIAAELMILTLSNLGGTCKESSVLLLEVDSLAGWCQTCLESRMDVEKGTCDSFSTIIRISRQLLPHLCAERTASLLESIFVCWLRIAPSSENKKRGIQFLGAVLRPPLISFNPFVNLGSTDVENISGISKVRVDKNSDPVIAKWITEIPPLLWKQKKPEKNEDLYTYGLSVLLNAARYTDRGSSVAAILPKTMMELQSLSVKISPLFVVNIKGKVVEGPLLRLSEKVQKLAVDVMYHLPGLERSLISLANAASNMPCAISSLVLTRIFEAIQMKTQYGDPEQVWRFIYSSIKGSDASSTGYLQKETEGLSIWKHHALVIRSVTQIALHCSPPELAIEAILPSIMESRNQLEEGEKTRSGYGVLYFLCKAVGRMKPADNRVVLPEDVCNHAGECILSLCFDMDKGLSEEKDFMFNNMQAIVKELVQQCPDTYTAFVGKLTQKVNEFKITESDGFLKAMEVLNSILEMDVVRDLMKEIDSTSANLDGMLEKISTAGEPAKALVSEVLRVKDSLNRKLGRWET